MPEFSTMGDIAAGANSRFLARNGTSPVGCVSLQAVDSYLRGLYDTVYAALSHNHAGTYSPIDHDHAGLYLTESEILALTESNQAGAEYVCVVDEKPLGTYGGSFTSGARRIRDINTIMHDDTEVVQVSGNQITLPAGTYRARIIAPGINVGVHRIWLRDITNSADLGESMSSLASAGSQTQNNVVLVAYFVVSEATVFEVQHQCTSSQNTYGFGYAVGFGSVEIYTIAEFWRVAT